MSSLERLLVTATGITTLISLLAGFGAGLLWLTARQKGTSLREDILGHGIDAPRDYIRLLKAIPKDHRSAALTTILTVGAGIDKSVVDKVKHDIDITYHEIEKGDRRAQLLAIIALVFLGFAFLGFADHYVTGSDPNGRHETGRVVNRQCERLARVEGVDHCARAGRTA